ncbi:MAG: hypothetical protein SFY70_09415 [Bacteroidia bacterium]|nr:hypothetical protein [Bacteroidia bacterium]
MPALVYLHGFSDLALRQFINMSLNDPNSLNEVKNIKNENLINTILEGIKKHPLPSVGIFSEISVPHTSKVKMWVDALASEVFNNLDYLLPYLSDYVSKVIVDCHDALIKKVKAVDVDPINNFFIMLEMHQPMADLLTLLPVKGFLLYREELKLSNQTMEKG